MMKQKCPLPTGFFYGAVQSRWQEPDKKRQNLVGTDAAYIYPVGNPVYLQTPGM
jgi:hypothetical protein